MDPETRKVIDWLNSPNGCRWSFSTHRQSAHAVKWFSLKPDVESPRGTDNMDVVDDMHDVVYIDLGYYNPETRKFNLGPRRGKGYQSYRTRK